MPHKIELSASSSGYVDPADITLGSDLSKKHLDKRKHQRRSRHGNTAKTLGEKAQADWVVTRKFLGFSSDEAYALAADTQNDPDTHAEYEHAKALTQAEEHFTAAVKNGDASEPLPITLMPEGQNLLRIYESQLGDAFNLSQAIESAQRLYDRASAQKAKEAYSQIAAETSAYFGRTADRPAREIGGNT